jgi:hypothetical protein
MPTVLLASRAQKQIDTLPEHVCMHIREALDELAEKGIERPSALRNHSPMCRPLIGARGMSRSSSCFVLCKQDQLLSQM